MCIPEWLCIALCVDSVMMLWAAHFHVTTKVLMAGVENVAQGKMLAGNGFFLGNGGQ